MMTLADLSREKPNEEEVKQLFALMENESDRGCAVLCGSFVEAAVEMAVAARFVDDPSILDGVFQGSGAPLSTFSGKIRTALALGMYGPETSEKLKTIKDIRNAFAHALRPLDFSHPTIVKACKDLWPDAPLMETPHKLSPARIRYIATCRTLFGQIYKKAQEEGGKEISYELP